jgi:N-methylhydantoinase A
MFDVVAVGAGGGSIASVDAGGMLRVGPRSAGAEPGPACYGRGGTEATVTDANVVLGIIRPERFLGGRMRLDAAAAQRVCADLGQQLGTDAIGAARAIVRVATEGMLGALRLVSTERGVNPQGHWLLCYGGAGAQHAVVLAEELGMRGVIVPRHPGLFSAYGLLIADVQRDWSAPLQRSVQALAPHELRTTVEQLQESARKEFHEVGGNTNEVLFRISLDMHYPGQAFELEVEVGQEDLDAPEVITARFHEQHRLRYGHSADAEVPDIVAVRIAATVPSAPLVEDHTPCETDAVAETVPLDVNGQERSVSFFQRTELGQHQGVAGPAVIEEDASTVWVPPGWAARTNHLGHLQVEREMA